MEMEEVKMKNAAHYPLGPSGLILIIFLICFGQTALAQSAGPVIKSRDYPQGYFRSPLDIPHQASGTFGELRSTHFHAGDDYRTQQKVGLPLYAVAEGYISRLRIQAGGGGHSLYITHPNGYTSVYLHMHEFAPQHGKRVREEQYAQQRFEVDIKLGENEFPVKKGDRIGLAGNTGSSEGPHLHFEIRDTETQDPINPQLFGLRFPDNLPPLIQSIVIYDLGDEVFNEHTPRRHFKTVHQGSGRYSQAASTPIPVNGRFGIGIQTVDRHNGTTFNNGVYSIELMLDGHLISTVVFEKLSFSTSGTIHAYIDYPHYQRTRTRIQKSFRDPNNPIAIFYHLEGDGSIRLEGDRTAGKARELTYRVRDVHGNTSLINIPVRHDPAFKPERVAQTGTAFFRYDRDNQYRADNIALDLPKNVLYDHLYFNYSQGSKPNEGYSLVQHVHNNMIPLAGAYTLSIRPDQSLSEHLQTKALIVDARGNSIGGTFQDGWVSTQTRSFGSFHIQVDTVAPQIQPVNVSPGKNLAAQSRISFRISDNLSGIASYNAFIDDDWVLMEYDPKTRSLWHTIDPGLSKGRHQFRLEVKDGKNNESRYEFSFSR